MISVVVPAAWGFEPFCDFLSTVVELNVIGEVIIINNNVAKTPTHTVLNHEKIRMYNQEKNIFVNPAWNLGVSLAKYDKICVLSDDVLIDLRLFIEADRFITSKIGILGIGLKYDVFRLHNQQFDMAKIENVIVTGNLKFKAFGETSEALGFGSLFFIHKDNWIEIPSEFKLYWGDTWIFELQTALGRLNYFINDCFYYSPWHMAVKTGVGAEYQQTIESQTYENREYFEGVKSKKIKELRGELNGG